MIYGQGFMSLSCHVLQKARVSEARAWLAQLALAAGEEEAPAALHLAALLDWVLTLPLQPHNGLPSPVSPTLPTPPSPSKAGMGVEELGCDVGRDLMVLATRLQESLADPAAQEAVLLDTITVSVTPPDSYHAVFMCTLCNELWKLNS